MKPRSRYETFQIEIKTPKTPPSLKVPVQRMSWVSFLLNNAGDLFSEFQQLKILEQNPFQHLCKIVVDNYIYLCYNNYTI